MYPRHVSAEDRDGCGQPVFERRRPMYQEESFKTQKVVYAHTRSMKRIWSIRCTAMMYTRFIT